MNRTWRFAFALLTCVAAACAPILGLDDLHARDAPVTGDSGGDATAADADAPKCTGNAECIKAAVGNPSLCVSGKCVDVNTTELCSQEIRPNRQLLERDDTIVVAAFIRGATPLQTNAGRAYDLALQEIENAGGILGRTPHRLAMLICDSDPTKVERGLKHVTSDLRLPAILAAFGSGDLAKLVANDVVDAGVFTMNPSFTTDFLRYSSNKRLVWSLLGTGEDVALAYRPVLQQLKAEKQLPADIKVALIATNGSLDQPMAEVLHRGPVDRGDGGGNDPSKALDMNGLSPEQDPSHFKLFPIDSEEFAVAPDLAKLNKAKNDLIAFEPDVIIALTGPEIESFLVDVDTALLAKNADAGTSDAGTTKKTYWILGPSNGAMTLTGGQITALGAYLAFDAPDVDSRRARFIGVQFAGATDTQERIKWRQRMIDTYKDAAAESLSAENFYDAMYWLAYGIAAAGPDAPVEGKSFTLGVRQLVSGPTKVFAGNRETVQRAFQDINLLTPEGTTFVGALGPPDIHEPTGTWNSVGATYCYPPHLEDGPVPTYDVRRYQKDGGLSSGKPLTCAN